MTRGPDLRNATRTLHPLRQNVEAFLGEHLTASTGRVLSGFGLPHRAGARAVHARVGAGILRGAGVIPWFTAKARRKGDG